MNKLCILGASGYIGSKISEGLDSKFQIINCSRKKINKTKNNINIRGDIKSPSVIKKIEKFNPDYLICSATLNHFDAEKNLISTIKNNNTALINLILKLKNLKKIIYFSSFQVYGNYLKYDFISEKTNKDPKNNYGLSHSLNEDLLFYLSKKKKLSIDVIRLTNAYGYPSNKKANCWWLVVNDLCKKYVQTNKIVINSDGTAFRNFIHIDDVLSFIKILLRKKSKEFNLYNLSSNETVSIIELAKLIYQNVDDKPEIYINKNIKLDISKTDLKKTKLKISNKKIKNINFIPKINLRNGIKNLINQLKRNEK